MNKGILIFNKKNQTSFSTITSAFLSALVVIVFSNQSMAKPQVYAESYQLHSKSTHSDREYYVRLPKGYDKNSSSNHPVIYFLTGQWSMLSAVAVIDAIEDDLPEFIILAFIAEVKITRQ